MGQEQLKTMYNTILATTNSILQHIRQWAAKHCLIDYFSTVNDFQENTEIPNDLNMPRSCRPLFLFSLLHTVQLTVLCQTPATTIL